MRRTLALSLLLILTACTTSAVEPRTDTAVSSSLAPLEYADAAASSVPDVAPMDDTPERFTTQRTWEIGNAAAPHTLTVFTNPSCAYCRQFAGEHHSRLLQDFVKHGSLKIETIVVPLRKYPESEAEAAALSCAALQGKGSGMYEGLFVADTSILQTAKDIGLDIVPFQRCLQEEPAKQASAIQKIHDAGVTLVPSFRLDGDVFTGLPFYPDLRGRIEELVDVK